MTWIKKRNRMAEVRTPSTMNVQSLRRFPFSWPLVWGMKRSRAIAHGRKTNERTTALEKEYPRLVRIVADRRMAAIKYSVMSAVFSSATS